MNVFQLITYAYVRNGDPLLNDNSGPFDTSRVRRGPNWVYSDTFEVSAVALDAPAKVMGGPMLQALLEDRFHLKLHRETEEAPVYELRVLKGGLLGPMPKQ